MGTAGTRALYQRLPAAPPQPPPQQQADHPDGAPAGGKESRRYVEWVKNRAEKQTTDQEWSSPRFQPASGGPGHLRAPSDGTPTISPLYPGPSASSGGGHSHTSVVHFPEHTTPTRPIFDTQLARVVESEQGSPDESASRPSAFERAPNIPQSVGFCTASPTAASARISESPTVTTTTTTGSDSIPATPHGPPEGGAGGVLRRASQGSERPLRSGSLQALVVPGKHERTPSPPTVSGVEKQPQQRGILLSLAIGRKYGEDTPPPYPTHPDPLPSRPMYHTTRNNGTILNDSSASPPSAAPGQVCCLSVRRAQ